MIQDTERTTDNFQEKAFSRRQLLLIGFTEPFHIGAMLYRAAHASEIQAQFCDASRAYQGTWLMQQINWRLCGHRPNHLESFSQDVVQLCKTYRPDLLLVTGMLPPTAKALIDIRKIGITCINYLTDDPWNPKHKANWFMEALPKYHSIFSPRRANLNDLAQIGCQVTYLPFGYDSNLHFPESPPLTRASEFECDVLFYGGADEDRVPHIASLIEAGYKIHLYGSYWDRYTQTRSAHRGMADSQTLRWAISGAKITLCLVRRANRDGHVMRTFEAPAMGACLLVEDTEEHREILGNDMNAVAYFTTIQEMHEKVILLLNDDTQRKRLIENAKILVAQEKNSYATRLSAMIKIAIRK